MEVTPKRGGTRQGSGRPKKADSQKRVKTAITMKPEHYEATKGNRSGMIENALDYYLNRNKFPGATSSFIRVTTKSEEQEPMIFDSGHFNFVVQGYEEKSVQQMCNIPATTSKDQSKEPAI